MNEQERTFYQQFEDEPGLCLRAGARSISPWDGYVLDLLAHPPLDGAGWQGLTRDFHQSEGVYGRQEACPIPAAEYLEDLKQYRGRPFDCEESAAALEQLLLFLEWAVREGLPVTAHRL